MYPYILTLSLIESPFLQDPEVSNIQPYLLEFDGICRQEIGRSTGETDGLTF